MGRSHWTLGFDRLNLIGWGFGLGFKVEYTKLGSHIESWVDGGVMSACDYVFSIQVTLGPRRFLLARSWSSPAAFVPERGV